ncbi:hypothetical protein ACFV30_34010 [Streptomyces sp. NPDC059752]|uniref:hypothetical protein n=1 Tax=unclassified Streptomyces TaxID=2593676 RepID=UPI0036592788
MTQPPQRLSMGTFVALCDILRCTPNDLRSPPGVLPRRHEHLAHLEHWTTHTMPALLAPHHTPMIRPFAE